MSAKRKADPLVAVDRSGLAPDRSQTYHSLQTPADAGAEDGNDDVESQAAMSDEEAAPAHVPNPSADPDIIDTMPAWMKHGRVVNRDSAAPIESLGLPPALLAVLRDQMDITTWFAMQAEVIPAVLHSRLNGHDVCVSAPTGSGKTLAYVVPILSVLAPRVVCRLRALATEMRVLAGAMSRIR